MRGTSQTSRDAVLEAFDPVATAAGKDALAIAEQLYSVVDVLDSSGSLRRALTDPARLGHDKAELVDALFSNLDPRTVDVLRDFAHARWSEDKDLAESIELAGAHALFAYAEQTGMLDTVEEELFRVERLLSSNRELLTAVSNRSATKESRLGVFNEVFDGKLSDVTKAMLVRAVGVPRGRRVVPTIELLLAAAAKRRSRVIANVSAAVELSAAQRSRLAKILSDAYGKDIQINATVDPQVLGGIRVQVGAEVVDGTVLARLDDARRRLVG
jgi:F-type H+-transporting ATPase subunit delta